MRGSEKGQVASEFTLLWKYANSKLNFEETRSKYVEKKHAERRLLRIHANPIGRYQAVGTLFNFAEKSAELLAEINSK